MDLICDWCNLKIGEKKGNGKTHGICDNCLNQHFPHLADKIRGFLGVETINDVYRLRKLRIVQPTKIHRR